MKKISNIILVLALFLGIVGLTENSWAANNWYLDNTAPCGGTSQPACDGKSWNTAWKHPQYITWGSGGIVKPGDTLFISGGVNSQTYLIDRDNWLLIAGVDQGGTSDANRITVRIGQDPGHNGVAILDLQNSWNVALDSYAANYVTFDGEYNGQRHIKITNSKIYGGGWGGFLMYLYGSDGRGIGIVAKGIELEKGDQGLGFAELVSADISNFNIHDIRNQTGIYANLSANQYDAFKIHDSIIKLNSTPDGIEGCGGCSIYNNIFDRDYNGSVIQGMSFGNGVNAPAIGDIITGGTSGSSGTLVKIELASGSWSAGTASGNFWVDTNTGNWQNGENLLVGTKQIAVNNTSSGYWASQHPDYIQGSAWYIKIYNNTFRNTADSAIDFDVSGDPSHIMVYNNLFYQDTDLAPVVRTLADAPGPTGMRFYCSGSYAPYHLYSVSDFHFYNNTFIDSIGSVNLAVSSSWPTATVSNFHVKNNLIINSSIPGYVPNINIYMPGANLSDIDIDRNLLIAGDHGQAIVTVNNQPYIQPTGFINQPSSTYIPFASYTEGAKTGNDFRLSASDTVAKDSGLPLSDYFSYDKDGLPRPQGAAWDIGAYEYPGSVTSISDFQAPSAPGNLSATAVSSVQINLSWLTSTDNVRVIGYKIFRGGIQVGVSIANSYSDKGLNVSTNYSYTVSAFDAAGNVSGLSNSASATTLSANNNPPVAYWKLDEGSGTTAIDSSGNNNNAILDGPVWISGKIGSALSFDGINDLTSGNAVNFVYPEMSFAFWMKVDNSSYGIPVSWSPYRFCAVNSYGSGNLICTVVGDSSYGVTTNGNILDNLWHHVVFTSTANNQALYLDGVLVSSDSRSLATGSGVIQLGARPFGPGYYKGMLDEVRIYNGALTSQQVSALYNSYTLSVIYGDVSGDSQVTAYDAALTAQAAVGLITFTSDRIKAGDVDGSGSIAAYDAALIAQKAVGLITKFPVEL